MIIISSNECRCASHSGTQGIASNCNKTCTGNSNQICGGLSANSIYVAHSDLDFLTQHSSYQAIYVGCAIDRATRDLSFNFLVNNKNMALDVCAIHCNKYEYFGTQVGYYIINFN